MRKLIAFLGTLLLVSSVSFAQTTVISGNTIDSDSVAWIGGTISVQFVPNPAQPNINVYNINGTLLNPSVLNQGPITLGSSGSFSVSVYTNSAVSPAGSQWQFTICPLATSKCGILLLPAVGSTQNITAAVTATIPAPRFPAVIGNYGYSDVEAVMQLVPGNIYYNVINQCYRGYSGLTWGCVTGNALSDPVTISQGGTGATSAQSGEINLITGSGGASPCTGVVNNGSTSDSTALQTCMTAGRSTILPSSSQGGIGSVYLTAPLNLNARGTLLTGTAWGNMALEPTTIVQSASNADGVVVQANRAGSYTIQAVKISNLNVATSGTASSGVGIHATDTSGDGAGYNGDLISYENLLVGNSSHNQGFSQCLKSIGYGNGYINGLECYASTDTDSGLYGGEVGGTTSNSWTILNWMGGCTNNNAGSLSFDGGLGNFIKTRDTDGCANVLNVGTNSMITAQVMAILGDHESQTGTTSTIQAASRAVIFDIGSGINMQNSTSPMHWLGGGSSLTLYSPPVTSKLATNYPTFTVAPVTGTGTKVAGTYTYALYGTNPTGETITSPTQVCTLSLTGECTLTFTQLPGISNLQVCEQSAGTLYTFTNQPVLEGNTATWSDNGSLSLSANVCPTTSTLYYGLATKTTYQDDISVLGPFVTGSGGGIGELVADQNGEWYNAYDHIPEVTTAPSGTSVYWDRLGCVKYAAPLVSAANDGLYCAYRNASGGYVWTSNLFQGANYGNSLGALGTTGTGALVEANAPTINNPVLNGICTGTGCSSIVPLIQSYGTGLIEVLAPSGNSYTAQNTTLTACTGEAQVWNVVNTATATIKFTSAGTLGDCSGFTDGGTARTNGQPLAVTGVAFTTTTDYSSNSRIWLGYFPTGCSVATVVASDAPACATGYAAMRLSTTASDSTWECITFDGSTQTITAMGAPTTSYQPVKLNVGASSVSCTVGTTTVTNTTHLPETSSATAWYWMGANTITSGSTANHIIFSPLVATYQNTSVLY